MPGSLALPGSPRPSEPSTAPPPPESASKQDSKPSEPESTPSSTSHTSADDESASAASLHKCQWIDCDKALPDPEALYNHLCNDHIGRKSTGNLCLTCKWKDCGTTCAKRDHITSHLRVHTPLKPHICEICKKPFKRPQDLKKHEKIHTEEHHAAHKHSKAITVSDPAYSSRVRGDSSANKLGLPPKKSGSPDEHLPMPRAKSDSLSLSESSSDFGILPTPSPDIDHSPIHYAAPEVHGHDLYSLQNSMPTWEVLRSEGPPSHVSSGAKRSYDAYSVGDFFTDVKKRRLGPSYDSDMAERLNTLAQSQSLSAATIRRLTVGPPTSHPPPASFNPRSVSFDIRSPEELAAVNEFLITLGRDVANAPGSSASAPNGVNATPRSAHPGSASDDYPYFDAASLSQLGLAGMPGVPSVPSVPSVPGSGAGYHGDAGYGGSSSSGMMNGPHVPSNYPSRASHQSVQPVQYSIYPTVDGGNDFGYPSGPRHGQSQSYSSRRISLSPAGSDDINMNRISFHQPTPSHHHHPSYLTSTHDSINPLLAGGSSPLSSHSAMSTPPNATPPHLHSVPMGFHPDGAASFDYLRHTRGPPPTVQLGPVDLASRNIRQAVKLRSVPTGEAGRPEPMEPKLGTDVVHRGPPAKLTVEAVSNVNTPASSLRGTAGPSSLSSRPSTASSDKEDTSSSLYPLLVTSGDAQYKLAPLNPQNKARYRSPITPTAPSSRASTLSPVASPRSPKYYDEDEPMRSASPDHHRSKYSQRDESSEGSLTPSPPPILPSLSSITGNAVRPRPLPSSSSTHRPTLHPSSSSSSTSSVSSTPAPTSRLYPDVNMEDATGRLGKIALSSSTSSPSTSTSATSSPRPTPRTKVAVALSVEEERKRHAALIRDILVNINLEYRRMHGTPSPSSALTTSGGMGMKRVRREDVGMRDVEMVGA